jgi:hypothetical protein
VESSGNTGTVLVGASPGSSVVTVALDPQFVQGDLTTAGVV